MQEAYEKAELVISSCTTIDHVVCARNYVDSFMSAFPECRSETFALDRRLLRHAQRNGIGAAARETEFTYKIKKT